MNQREQTFNNNCINNQQFEPQQLFSPKASVT